MNELIELLNTSGKIPEADQALISNAFGRCFKKSGEELFQSQHICKELFFICKGVLRIRMRNEKGNDVTHFFLKENQFCTILNSFKNEVPAEESILAACDAEVLAISRSALLMLYQQLPYLETRINEIIQQGLLDKVLLRNSYLGIDSSARYKLFLEKQRDIAPRVSLSDVASYLGVTQQSLSRIRRNVR